MKKLNLLFIFPILLLSHAANAGQTCVTNSNGLWSESSTWISCNGSIPLVTDSVTVNHEVIFDVVAEIESLFITASGLSLIHI